MYLVNRHSLFIEFLLDDMPSGKFWEYKDVKDGGLILKFLPA